jgi:hypothetical protein
MGADAPCCRHDQRTVGGGFAVNNAVRALWLALMIFFSLAVGVLAGILTHAGGDSLPVSVLTGGGSFGATLLLLMAVFHFATATAKR